VGICEIDPDWAAFHSSGKSSNMIAALGYNGDIGRQGVVALWPGSFGFI
jgi:hypothetical protein